MKNNNKPLPIETPQSLINKLKSYSKESLTDDERAILNTVFGVFNYTMKNRNEVFKGEPEFLNEISNAELAVGRSIDGDETITNLTTLTTVPISPSIYICEKERF